MDGEAISLNQAIDELASGMLATEAQAPEKPEDDVQEAPEAEAAPEEEVSTDEEEVEEEVSASDPEDADSDGEPEAVDPEADEEVKAEQPSIDPPQFWKAEDKERFAKLPADVQRVIVDREREAQALVTKANMERAEAVKAAEAAKADVGQIDQVLDQARQKFDRWRGYDWAKMAQEDPDRYVRDKAQYDTELQTAQQLFQAKQVAEAKQYQAFVKEQEAKLSELVPELTDKQRGDERKRELAEWLISNGATPEELKHITAWQTKVAWDAYRMSRVSQNAPKAVQKPAPKPVKPAATVSAQSGLKKQLEAARKELDKTGSMAAAQKVMLLEQQLKNPN